MTEVKFDLAYLNSFFELEKSRAYYVAFICQATGVDLKRYSEIEQDWIVISFQKYLACFAFSLYEVMTDNQSAIAFIQNSEKLSGFMSALARAVQTAVAHDVIKGVTNPDNSPLFMDETKKDAEGGSSDLEINDDLIRKEFGYIFESIQDAAYGSFFPMPDESQFSLNIQLFLQHLLHFEWFSGGYFDIAEGFLKAMGPLY